MPQNTIADIHRLMAEQNQLIIEQTNLIRSMAERLDRGDARFDQLEGRLNQLEGMWRESEQRARIYQTVASENKSRLEHYQELARELQRGIDLLQNGTK